MLSLQANQIADAMRHFIRLKSRFASVLPADLAQLRERLSELHPEGSPGHEADYNLFYRIGVILSDAGEPVTMSELSEALAVPLSTATRMVDWLVKSAYAERLDDPQDRRIVRVALTGNGRHLYQSINEFVTDRIEQILRRLTAEERKNLVVLLRRLVQALEEEVG